MLLFAHDDKVAALTAYYTSILGAVEDTRWAFDLDQLYAGRDRAAPEQLVEKPGELFVPWTPTARQDLTGLGQVFMRRRGAPPKGH